MKILFSHKDAAGTDGKDDSLNARVYHVLDDHGFQWICRVPGDNANDEEYIIQESSKREIPITIS